MSKKDNRRKQCEINTFGFQKQTQNLRIDLACLFENRAFLIFGDKSKKKVKMQIMLFFYPNEMIDV